MERVVVFPRRAGTYKKHDASKEDVAAVRDPSKHVRIIGKMLPNIRADGFSEIKKSDMPEGEEAAYRKLREARSEARLVGVREKRAKAKADEATAAKK